MKIDWSKVKMRWSFGSDACKLAEVEKKLDGDNTDEFGFQIGLTWHPRICLHKIPYEGCHYVLQILFVQIEYYKSW